MPNSFTAAPGEMEYDGPQRQRQHHEDDGPELRGGICPACRRYRHHASDCSELARMERISAQIRQRALNDETYIRALRKLWTEDLPAVNRQQVQE